jgi:hypothetical protein
MAAPENGHPSKGVRSVHQRRDCKRANHPSNAMGGGSEGGSVNGDIKPQIEWRLRQCLRCEEEFDSFGPGNRICPTVSA